MLEKSLLEELQDASVSHEPTYVEFFNDGKIRTEEHGAKDRMSFYDQDETLRRVKFVFTDGAQTYAKNCSYDSISLGLEIGLVYNKEDVDDDNKIKENAKPLDLVHCYTGNITSYLNGEQSNEREYYHYNIQGFIKYDTLVSKMKKNGIDFVGPEDFEDFKASILSGEPFNISLDANLQKKAELVDEESMDESITEESVKEEPKKLVRKPFLGKIKKTLNL